MSVNPVHLNAVTSVDTVKQAWDAMKVRFEARDNAELLLLKIELNNLQKWRRRERHQVCVALQDDPGRACHSRTAEVDEVAASARMELFHRNRDDRSCVHSTDGKAGCNWPEPDECPSSDVALTSAADPSCVHAAAKAFSTSATRFSTPIQSAPHG